LNLDSRLKKSLLINLICNLKWAFWTENEKSEQFIFHRATTPAIRVIKSLNSQTGKYLDSLDQFKIEEIIVDQLNYLICNLKWAFWTEK